LEQLAKVILYGMLATILNHGFLKADPKSWQQNTGYITAHNFLKNLNAASDISECALGMLTAFLTREKFQEVESSRNI